MKKEEGRKQRLAQTQTAPSSRLEHQQTSVRKFRVVPDWLPHFESLDGLQIAQ
jgi:hypothetical protein